MSEVRSSSERLRALLEFLNVAQAHSFTFAPVAAWRMGDEKENAAMLRLYPSATCAEGFCASCNLYLIVDLRYSPNELPWTGVRSCEEIRTENNRHPRDAMRNDGMALVWAAHHGLTKMVDTADHRAHDSRPLRMRWFAPGGVARVVIGESGSWPDIVSGAS